MGFGGAPDPQVLDLRPARLRPPPNHAPRPAAGARDLGVVVALWTDSSPRTHAVRNVTGAGWASPPSAGGPADQFTLMTQLSAGGVDSDTAVGETQLGETVALPLVSPVMTPTKSPGM